MAAPSPQPPPGPTPPASKPKSSSPRVFVAQRTSPLPAAGGASQATELAGELGFRVRRFFADQWDDFRAADAYFKAKAGIVALYVAISVGSIVVAFSGGQKDPSANDLGAYVRVDKTSLGWALLLHNTTDDAWTSCKLTLNGQYLLDRPLVAPGEKVVLGTTQFTKDGRPAPAAEEPRALQVACAEGSTVPTLSR